MKNNNNNEVNFTKNHTMVPDFYELSGKEFKFIRLYAGYTQTIIAKACGIKSKAAVSEWEKSERVSEKRAAQLHYALGDELFYRAKKIFGEYKDTPDILFEKLRIKIQRRDRRRRKVVNGIPSKLTNIRFIRRG